MKEMKNDNKPQKSILTYYIVILLVTLLLNALIFPRMWQPNIVNVDYGTFRQELESGLITDVEMDEAGTTIYYLKNEQPSVPGGEQTIYAVGVWPVSYTHLKVLPWGTVKLRFLSTDCVSYRKVTLSKTMSPVRSGFALPGFSSSSSARATRIS